MMKETINPVSTTQSVSTPPILTRTVEVPPTIFVSTWLDSSGGCELTAVELVRLKLAVVHMGWAGSKNLRALPASVLPALGSLVGSDHRYRSWNILSSPSSQLRHQLGQGLLLLLHLLALQLHMCSQGFLLLL